MITVAYTVIVEKSLLNIETGSDAPETAWFSSTDLLELAFGHTEIIRKALEKFR